MNGMKTLKTWRARILAVGLATGAGLALAGCEDQLDSSVSGRSLHAISPQILALMDKIGVTQSSPILIRTYKKEAEFEVWKMKPDGQYALLKIFPMCRWSGQLGPKKREGDRQVPEGFYTITPGQMNPNSAYYLSFNVGYPNAFDKAWDRTGGTIMVHGICSSAGCYSMTDAQIADIYALARDAFNGGQREIQLQSYPFRMTAENLAKHRLDPNMDFWNQLKNGSDHFEVTKTEPAVLVCGKRYEFGAHAEGEVSARAPCPTLRRDEDVETAVAEKQAKDREAVAALVAKGVKPIRLVYEDGGQNPVFAGKYDTSRPDALVAAPREIALDNSGKPIPEVVRVAAAVEAKPVAPTPARLLPAAPAAEGGVKVAENAATPAASASPLGFVGGVADSSKALMTNLFKTAAAEPPPPALQVFEPEQPIPTDAPLPPKRSASLDSPVRMAALPSAAKPAAAADAAAQQ